MSRREGGQRTPGRCRRSTRGPWSAARGLTALLGVLLVAPGCGVVGDLFRDPAAGVVDAHVVYRLRADCPTLLARTLRNGYSVMTPLTDGFEAEETGLFEGPVRAGQSIYRYYPPTESNEWSDRWTEVSVDVQAVELGLREARTRLDAVCGPPVGTEGDEEVPRLPDDS